MRLSDNDAGTLREYLLRGGFSRSTISRRGRVAALCVPDEEGLPEYEPVDLPVTHPIFTVSSTSTADPSARLQYLYTNSMSEKGGVVPHYRGIVGHDGRVMVMITHNSDLGDAWEWSDLLTIPLYSLPRPTNWRRTTWSTR